MILWFFPPSWLKTARNLHKAGKRFVHYKKDILTASTLEQIQTCLQKLTTAIRAKDRQGCEEHGNELESLCNAVTGNQEHASLVENVEVIFVALTIALSITHFWIQPFMIPTGSMQPTLNGVKAVAQTEEEFEKWNALETLGQRVFMGRKLVESYLEEPKTLVGIEEKTRLRFFTWTELYFSDGSTQKLRVPKRVLLKDFGLEQRLFELANTPENVGRAPILPLDLPAGFLLARGMVSLGDQVLVNRVAYHFRAPERGEVFVFTTEGIPKIQQQIANQNLDFQYYIKRLVALPGESTSVRSGDPRLYIDGEPSTDAAVVRVGSLQDTAEGKYVGYSPAPNLNAHISWPLERDEQTEQIVQQMNLGEGEYLALGDNGASSQDSRCWGPVEEQNLVGPALFSIWPLHSHWGKVD